MITRIRRLAWFGTAALGLGGVAALAAQERTAAPALDGLAAVTSELRLLRAAVEDATRAQTQTQALGVYLSAQQSRLLQVAGRLDAARRELDGLALRNQESAARLSEVEQGLTRVSNQDERAQLEQMLAALKHELAALAGQEQAARSREAELLQDLQTEEARWTDLTSRLEQLIRR